MSNFDFTQHWFAGSAKPIWDHLIPKLNPHKVLEIGSFEGASACYLIRALADKHPLELHCIDTWEGGVEHQNEGNCPTDMGAVERRFNHNTQLAISNASHPVTLRAHKGLSDEHLPRLIAEGQVGSFDFIYVDGSHQAPDVLIDAVLSFKLLKVGGVMGFDDHLWSEVLPYGIDPLRCPKAAVDAFVNLFIRKLRVVPSTQNQFYIQKTTL